MRTTTLPQLSRTLPNLLHLISHVVRDKLDKGHVVLGGAQLLNESQIEVVVAHGEEHVRALWVVALDVVEGFVECGPVPGVSVVGMLVDVGVDEATREALLLHPQVASQRVHQFSVAALLAASKAALQARRSGGPTP